jgi:hypothetical protein
MDTGRSYMNLFWTSTAAREAEQHPVPVSRTSLDLWSICYNSMDISPCTQYGQVGRLGEEGFALAPACWLSL